MKDYSFLSRPAYFETLANVVELAARGERVIVATMDFDPLEPAVQRLVEALRTAAHQHANVTLLIDAHNFLQDRGGKPGPLFYRGTLNRVNGASAASVAALESIEGAGGHCVVTNIPKRRFNPPMVGRSHIKGAVVGNRVFVGGCNLEHAEQIDVMVTWKDLLAAEKLSNWLLRIADTGSARQALSDVDAEVALDETTRLLIDSGVPRQSLIYDEALQLIDSAQEWIYMTCQYFPGGPTARHLAAAQARGVKVEIDFSHPRTHGSSAAIHYAHQAAQRARRLPRNFFVGKLDKQVPKLHAKVLASEQGAMLGSHNYVIQGVRFGTAELALKSLDSAFSLELRSFMHAQLAAFSLSTRRIDSSRRAKQSK